VKPLKITLLISFLALALPFVATTQTAGQWLDKGIEHNELNELDSARISFNNVYKSDSLSYKIFAIWGMLKSDIFASDLTNGDSLINIGDSLSALHEFDKAVFVYKLAKAEFYKKSSNYIKAKAFYKEVMPKGEDLEGIETQYAAGLQHYGLLYEQLSQYDSSAYFMEKANDVFKNQNDTLSFAYGLLCNNMGSVYLRLSDMPTSKMYFQKALDIFSNQEKPSRSYIAMVLGNLAVIYSNEWNVEEAIEMTEKALQINRLEDDKDAIGYNYYSLGVNNYYKGDYGRAKDYLEQCVVIREKIYGEYHSILIGPLEVIAMTLEDAGNSKVSMPYYQRSRKIIQRNYKDPTTSEGFNLENIALLYYEKNMQDSALVYIQNANKILEVLLPELSEHRAIHYSSLGKINIANDKLLMGRNWLKKSLALLEKLDLEDNLSTVSAIMDLAFLESSESNWKIADAYFKRAKSLIEIDDMSNPTTNNLSPYMLNVINDFMHYVYGRYEKQNEEKDLIAYEKYSKLYYELSEKLRRQFNDPYTKSALVKNSVPVFRSQIGTYASLYNKTKSSEYLENIFRQAEYSRATMIRDMQDEKIASYARVDEETMINEKALKQALSSANEAYFQYPDSTEIMNNLFKAKEQLNSFIAKTSAENPKYHELKFGGDMPSLTDIKSELKTDQVLVEYMIDDSSYYAMAITNEKVEMVQLGSRDSIDMYIGLYKVQLAGNGKINDKINISLYNYLWKPITSLNENDRVIICPISSLHYLNFETLKESSTDNFLIEGFNISYSLSANIYTSKEMRSKNSKNLALAIAPGFEDELKEQYKLTLDSTITLDDEYMHTIRQPWSVKLAEKLKAEYRNKSFIGANAPESEVKSSLSQGSIIYFGTHAIANELDPLRSKLVLAKEKDDDGHDGYLHAYEIYGLDLNADLTILSACESGIGQLEDGEGMISLAHSIHYAGCPSTVLSLWKVDERSNTQLIDLFLENIAEGQVKSEALRNAKLSFLSENENAHPYFWGGMILMGQDGTVELARQSNWPWYVLAGALFFVAVLLFRKKRK